MLRDEDCPCPEPESRARTRNWPLPREWISDCPATFVAFEALAVGSVQSGNVTTYSALYTGLVEFDMSYSSRRAWRRYLMISESVFLFRGRQVSSETRLTSKNFRDVSQDSRSNRNRKFLKEYITYGVIWSALLVESGLQKRVQCLPITRYRQTFKPLIVVSPGLSVGWYDCLLRVVDRWRISAEAYTAIAMRYICCRRHNGFRHTSLR